MNRTLKGLIVIGAGAVVTIWGAGAAAAAPDVVGETYSDAEAAIDDGGGSAEVAVTVGSTLAKDDCIVTNAWDAPFLRNDEGEMVHSDDEVMLSLNCDGSYASSKHPGASVASPAGREAKLAAEKAKSEEEQALEAVSTPDE